MKILRDSRPFCQSLIKVASERESYLAQSQTVESPQDQNDSDATDDQKPCCLKPCGRDCECQRRTHVVPDTVVVTRDDMKPVRAMFEICVERLSTAPGINPVCIPSIQPV